MPADRPERARPATPDEPLLEGALAVLDLVYESAESPGRLVESLTRLAELIRTPSLLLFATAAGDRRLVGAARAPVATAISQPPGHLFQVRSDHLRTIPLAGGHELVVDPSMLDPARELLLLRLAPHLARALAWSARHCHDLQSEADLTARLDRAPLALLLLDAAGRVVLVNRAARPLLAAADSISLDGHRIALRHGVSRLLFEALVERVTAPPDGERQTRGGRLSFPDEAWGRVDILAAPFEARLAAGEARAAVLLSARGVSPTPEERLVASCGLSAEEARVAVDRIAGRSREDEPDRAAVDSVIQAIYRKLGTTRQSDLLRLVLRPAGVVFDSSPGQPQPS